MENGREPTLLNIVDWMRIGVDLGAGEILLTSVDNEGTRRGFDLGLIKKINNLVKVPIIISGGFSSVDDILKVINIGGIDAFAIADALHYKRLTITNIKSKLSLFHNGVRNHFVK